MNCAARTEIHPVEILIVAALVVAEAVITLLVALVTLTLTTTNRQPSASRTQPPAPFTHPLFSVAHDLQELTCTELRALSGTRKRLNKSQLVEMVVAVGV